MIKHSDLLQLKRWNTFTIYNCWEQKTALLHLISQTPKESRARLMNTVIANLEAFLKGNPENVVND